MNGKAQNNLFKYKEAIEILQAGLDFIIDNNDLEANFYKQLQTAYLALGNSKEATKCANKIQALKK